MIQCLIPVGRSHGRGDGMRIRDEVARRMASDYVRMGHNHLS